MISTGTKAALQAAKARGGRLGRNAERLAPANRAAALDHANQIKGVLAQLAGSGMTTREIAAELTARGITTPRGGRWHPQTVRRVMERVAL
jgi:DNA invertase Pin-like site-specific DNA recombinase